MIPTTCSVWLSPCSAALATTAAHNSITGTARASRATILCFIEPLLPDSPASEAPAARAPRFLSPVPRHSLRFPLPPAPRPAPRAVWPCPPLRSLWCAFPSTSPRVPRAAFSSPLPAPDRPWLLPASTLPGTASPFLGRRPGRLRRPSAHRPCAPRVRPSLPKWDGKTKIAKASKKSERSVPQAQPGGTVRRFGELSLAFSCFAYQFRVGSHAVSQTPVGAYGGPMCCLTELSLYSIRPHLRQRSQSVQWGPVLRAFIANRANTEFERLIRS